jgi:hypothetical protein
MVLLSFLLTNILCSFTPCFPTFEPPLAAQSETQIRTRSDVNRTKWPVVTTGTGDVQGFTMKTIGGRDIYAFEGIPFAEPPVGQLRFRVSFP